MLPITNSATLAFEPEVDSSKGEGDLGNVQEGAINGWPWCQLSNSDRILHILLLEALSYDHITLIRAFIRAFQCTIVISC